MLALHDDSTGVKTGNAPITSADLHSESRRSQLNAGAERRATGTWIRSRRLKNVQGKHRNGSLEKHSGDVSVEQEVTGYTVLAQRK